MLPVGWLVFAVVVAVLLTMWFTFTLTRLDRLHARVDAAQAAMDAQLVRRAAALQHVAESPDSGVPDMLRAGYDEVAKRALNTPLRDAERGRLENAVGRALAELALLPGPLRPDAGAELQEAAARVLIARRFYNDAVRDTRSLRAGRLPRLFRMAGRRPMPQFFDIDDTVPTRPAPARPTPRASVPVATTESPTTEEEHT
ncbi:MAG TPA: NUDIX hydrolase [Jatrophihabitans sp.]|nr:NUDIX hydrolase [Jatrophihabitans sp.]